MYVGYISSLHIGDSSLHIGESSLHIGESSLHIGESSLHIGDSSLHIGDSSYHMIHTMLIYQSKQNTVHYLVNIVSHAFLESKCTYILHRISYKIKRKLP